MTQPTEPPRRSRFAPVPIETTFKQRRGGPAAELTPEPSPTSESPPPQLPASPAHHVMTSTKETQTTNTEKRRFAPQLIESTRRSRRTGDIGPATKPVDKTDITPYQKHIYSLTNKKKHNRRPGHARRESCDDEISKHVFDLNKLDVQRELEEIALAAFPNSGIRTGGAEHWGFVREGSASGSEDEERIQRRAKARGARKDTKGDSSEEDVGWAVKEMQQHHGQLAKDRDDDDHSMTDSMSARSDGPPDNTFDFTNRARHTIIRSSLGPLSPIGENPMPFIPSEPVALSLGKPDSQFSYFGNVSYDTQPPLRPIGESHMPYIPSGPTGKADVEMPDAPSASQIPPETGFAKPRGAFGRFYGYENQPLGNSAASKAAEKEAYRLRSRMLSPPMAGKDLVFRMVPSPKQTKLEPDQKWDHNTGTHVEPNRDQTEKNGLWRGYCFTTNKGGEALAPSPRPAMIMTPMQPATPFEHTDPYANTQGTLAPFPVSGEPSQINSGSSSGFTTAEHRSRAGQPKGLHMLMGLEQSLHKEKASADLEEKISAEFTDQFVTQVYNYLSLGYPAMARAFDDELSKISKISVDELEMEDDTVMDGIGSSAKGHLKISMELDMSEDKRCPRWKALKRYIFEWARQHPDLDGISPLAWGVAERRGSWGI